MALYFYQALSRDGSQITGTYDAASVTDVRKYLVGLGSFPTKIELASSRKSFIQEFGQLFVGSVSIKDKLVFTKQLSVLLKAGVPLLQSLELLSDQFKGRFHQILVELKDFVKEGKSLADGMSRYPDVFDGIYVQLVRAGEASGQLEMILERLVGFMEKSEEFKSKVRGALIYPVTQLVIIFAAALGILVFIVPKLKDALLQMTKDKDIPWYTQIVFDLSDGIRNYWWMFLIGLAVVVIAFAYWKSTVTGQLRWDKLKLKLPLIKVFTRQGAIVRFCQTLGMLLNSGVNLSESLDIVVKVVDNKVLSLTLEEARDKILKQGKIAQYLNQTNIFPTMAIYMISTGEQSGELGGMLNEVGEIYGRELNELADNLTKTLEPLMIVVMAIVVGGIVGAVLIPILMASQNIQM
ncbi:MAG: General secretion pathway protein F [candidate division TM6 bacterium GW2011_GWF2_32_72]|nr:MAG: General secretion pathway protein F [candidate division TM6 bacterium GW2011_GWF2_32_72]